MRHIARVWLGLVVVGLLAGSVAAFIYVPPFKYVLGVMAVTFMTIWAFESAD